MKKYIVITTINPKTEGIARFEAMPGWHVVVVGDRKSQPIESSEHLTFLSLEEQARLGYEFAAACPLDHYARKNIGYLYAMEQGADVIYETDDDNIPYPTWQLIEFECEQRLTSSRAFANVYAYFSDRYIWPRGYPLEEIRSQNSIAVEAGAPVRVGVWQGVVDGSPDVDAIFRLVFDDQIRFEDRPPVALARGTYCPFNSQNTLWHRDLFYYLYLPSTVSFRFTDILRGYIAQRLAWEHDLHLGFMKAMVYQERNPHNLMRDFADEVEAYLHVGRVVSILSAFDAGSGPSDNLERVYSALLANGLVGEDECRLLSAWLHDIEAIRGSQGSV